MNLASAKDIERIRRKIPVTLFAFDLLWYDGRDLTREPLETRRALLEDIATETDLLRLTLIVDGEGRAFYESAKQLRFEGVVAKRLGSRYEPGRRTKDWRKIKALNHQDCVILGWTPGSGSRTSTFGALLVGAYRKRDGDLIWIGQVGTGFTDAFLADLMGQLKGLRSDEPPIEDPELRKLKGATWVRPELVCEVEFLEMTEGGKLRAPSFKGLRPDKLPADCVIERPAT
jgi:bifunctional non-homologous end joining protein LigD